MKFEENQIKGAVLNTTDYGRFHSIKGNRPINEMHVKELIKSFTEFGNLTPDYPIDINDENGVQDGQHRLEVCKRLGWPVHYRITPNISIEVIQALNRGRRNWGWRDYGDSYAKLGVEHYKQFMGLADQYNLPFRTLMVFSAFPGKGADFRAGKYELKDKARTFHMLNQLNDVLDMLRDEHRCTGIMMQSLYTIFNSPNYDHKRMIGKIEKYHNQLKGWANISDYMRNFEDIYNYNQTEETRVRLF
jgi:hypothetical protein